MAPNYTFETVENPNVRLKIPEWIKEDLFQQFLENDIPGYSKITRFMPIAATAPGENYTSTMLRVLINVELKDGTTVFTSYIVKTAIDCEETRSAVDSINAFPKEKEIYESILPKYEQLFTEVGKKIKFGPSCKFVKDTPEHVTIIMEDLRQREFSNVSRYEGLDLDHITNVLEKLAEFHAVSAVYNERFGPYSQQLRNCFYVEEHRDVIKKLSMDESFIEALPKWGDCERYIPLWPNPDKLFDWFLNATSPAPNEFNVLNHGDFWSNNIMFQYNDEGKINETYFVDFQLTQWGTPAQDLNYLITGSAHYDLRVQEFDRLLKIYHEHLSANLKLLKYSKPIPNLKDIHIMMIKYSLWSFQAGTSLLSTALAEADTSANVGNLISAEENAEQFRQKMLMNPRYVKTIKQLLPWWENRGVFQF